MKLSVIIPTKGRKQILATTVAAAVQSTEHLNAEIIVVNDSKTDLPELPSPNTVKVLNNPKAGVASARNFGFRHAAGDLILFLDNDIIISRKSVDHICKLHDSHPHACFNLNWEYPADTLKNISLHPFTRFLKNFNMISFKGWYNDPGWKDDQLFASRSVASFHLSISRNDFEKSGGYNEAFPLAGFEDYDFPVRLKKAGVEFYIDSRVTVYHNEIDRLDLDNWLNNEQRRALTRKKAVNLGYDELALEYPLWKRIPLTLITNNETFLMRILNVLPNSKITDPLYFRLLTSIQASRIYKGYSSLSA